jgi:hypothetical protein
MVASCLIQALYDKSPNLTRRQKSSNLIIETHTQNTHDWQKFATISVAVKTARYESLASLTKSEILG